MHNIYFEHICSYSQNAAELQPNNRIETHSGPYIAYLRQYNKFLFHKIVTFAENARPTAENFQYRF